jgi:hypothetical protein
MAAPIPSSGGRVALARTLRDLRRDRWPGKTVTQRALAEAFGGAKPLSLSLISSWENVSNPTVPPVGRLLDYATFFSTERSIVDGHGRLIPEGELDDGERADRQSLYEKLLALRTESTDAPVATTAPPLRFDWQYPRGSVIRIVCGKLDFGNESNRNIRHPYARSESLNYTDLLTFANLDALVELFGHVRSVNPGSDVQFIRADRFISPDFLTNHLILLGSVGLNELSEQLSSKAGLPIRQSPHPRFADKGEIFEVGGGDDKIEYLPKVSGKALDEDVGLFARVPNPHNSLTTLTICNGVFARGVYGAVRILTDDQLRQQNERYLASRFAGASRFAILMRVPVLLGVVLTPDLQDEKTRLYEWCLDAQPRPAASDPDQLPKERFLSAAGTPDS